MTMEQNNTAAFNDTAGVLPMDTGVTANGIHNEGENNLSSSANAKKGRGRPPKAGGSAKVVVNSDTPKRARGRPPKAGETTPPIKKAVVLQEPIEEISENGDESKRKRGRPSKTNTPNAKVNGISKPQVQPVPVSIYDEQDDVDEPAKRKRGRPSGSPKKAVVVAAPSASKAASSKKKRGRPSGSAAVKQPASKPTVAASNDGSARKRGRPKKGGASPAAVVSTPANEITATAIPNNV